MIENRNRCDVQYLGSSLLSTPQDNSNILFQLRSKKKQTISQQQIIQTKIKQFFSDITIKLQDKEQFILKNFQNQMYLFYESIDNYCSMNEYERSTAQNRYKIDKILQWKFDTVEDKKFVEILDKGNIISVCCEQNMESLDILRQIDGQSSGISFQNYQKQKTSKKVNQKNLQLIKSAYVQQIGNLQQKIAKLLLKQDKLKLKICQMQSRLRMKKIGNAYLPVVSSNSINMSMNMNNSTFVSGLVQSDQKSNYVSNLLVKRLQSQNKILVQQLADCSQKLIALRSENSLLAKEKQKQRENSSSQILPTQKKRLLESVHIIQESIQQTQISQQCQQKIYALQSQLNQLRNQVQNKNEEHEKQMMQNCHMLQEYRIQMQQLNDYKTRIQRECESNIQKKVEYHQKLELLQKAHQQLEDRHRNVCKQLQNCKEMNNNYSKLLKLKQDKLIELDIQLKKSQIKLEESQSNYKKSFVQQSQKIQQKEQMLKGKQSEIQSLKSIIKKQQQEKSQVNDRIAKKQEEQYALQQKIRSQQAQLNKANKQRQLYCKKQISRVKKQMKKSQQEQIQKINEQFRIKYGQILQRIDGIKKQYIDNKDKYQKKFKLYETRMQVFKQKTAFQMKEMFEKVSKSNGLKQKEKLSSVIESYIQNQSSLTLKTTQIKMLKQEIVSLKKPPTKKVDPNKQQNITPVQTSSQLQVNAQMQLFSVKLYTQKIQLQQSIHENRIKQVQQQCQLKNQQKRLLIQNLTEKCNNYEKLIKQLKAQVSSVQSTCNPQLSQLRKANAQMVQKQQRLQSQISSLKSSFNKSQNQLQQIKQQIKLKKDIITGLKKQLKDKQLEKSKLNQTVSTLIQQSQRIKRTKMQANKKQAIFSQFKDKLINQTQLSQQICQLRTTLQQRTKQHKLELNKKQQIIKELKSSQQQLIKKVKSIGSLEDQIIDLKQKLKKNKLEIERKDTLIQHMKQKQQKAITQYQNNTQSSQNQLKRIRKQCDSQKIKYEALKIKFSKLQTNYQLVKLSFVKVYEQLCHKISVSGSFTSIHGQSPSVNNFLTVNPKQYNTFKSDSKKTRFQFTTTQKTQKQRSPQPFDMKKYKQALSILQISSEQFQMASNPNINNTKSMQTVMCSPVPNKMIMSTQPQVQDSVKLAKLLENQDIDSKAIVEIFSLVLES